MIYKFRVISDEVEEFYRDIEIKGSQTFFDFHRLLQENLSWDSKQMTSFYISNLHWEKIREITLYEMDMEGETDAVVMDVATIEEFVKDEKQRLLYIFDLFSERLFFIELLETTKENESQTYPRLTNSLGDAPEQVMGFNEQELLEEDKMQNEIDDIFNEYNEDEEDMRFENIDDYDL